MSDIADYVYAVHEAAILAGEGWTVYVLKAKRDFWDLMERKELVNSNAYRSQRASVIEWLDLIRCGVSRVCANLSSLECCSIPSYTGWTHLISYLNHLSVILQAFCSTRESGIPPLVGVVYIFNSLPGGTHPLKHIHIPSTTPFIELRLVALGFLDVAYDNLFRHSWAANK